MCVEKLLDFLTPCLCLYGDRVRLADEGNLSFGRIKAVDQFVESGRAVDD